MKRLIGVEMVRHLPTRNVDVRDTKLPGFLIRCRASGVHSYIVLLGRGRVMTLGRVRVLEPQEARKAARLALADVAHGKDPMAGRRRGSLTWGQYVAREYAPWVLANRKSGQMTVARLTAIFHSFDALPLTAISAFAVERWRTARLRAGLTSSTVNRDLVALRGALTKAISWGFLAVHPLAGVKQAHVDAIGHVRFLSGEEDARLRAALAARDAHRRAVRDAGRLWRSARGYPEALPAHGVYTDHLSPLVLTALGTGMRRGELFHLHWSDVDLAGARLTVRGTTAKSGVSRVIPLNTDVLGVLAAWQPVPCAPDALVFPNAHGMPLRDAKAAWHGLLKAAGITMFRWHDMRHHFASKLVQSGTDLNVVRQLLGHADLKQTLRYAHLRDGDLAAAVARLVR
jgi:integrase